MQVGATMNSGMRASRSSSATLRYGLESAPGLEVEVYQRDIETKALESGKTGGI